MKGTPHSQSSSITGASQSDCFVSYLGHSLGKSYPYAEKPLVYSAVPADWATAMSVMANIWRGKEIHRYIIRLKY